MIKTVTHCPTCGAECTVEGDVTHYYKPVAIDRIEELEANEKKWKEYAISWQDTITKLEQEMERLAFIYQIADRLEVLAVKWVDAGHHDWLEIKELGSKLREL